MIEKARVTNQENHKRAEEKTWNSDSEDEDEFLLDRVSAEKHILFHLRRRPAYSTCMWSDIAKAFAWLALCEYRNLSNDIYVQMIGFCNSDEKWNADDIMIEDEDEANEKYIGIINHVLLIIDSSRSDYVYRSVCFIILELMDPGTFTNKLNVYNNTN
jgi:hypothetical protein